VVQTEMDMVRRMGVSLRSESQTCDRARRQAVWLVGLLLVSSGLTACSTDDTYLPALLADPMASYEAEGIELLDRSSQGYRAERPFSQPAQVISVYRILDESRIEEALEQVVRVAEMSDWNMSEDLQRDLNFVGYKDLDVGEGRLILNVRPANLREPGTERALRMYLDFRSLP